MKGKGNLPFRSVKGLKRANSTGFVNHLYLKLIVAPVSLTERLDSQLMLMRASDHCPWMIATALSVLEEGEWNRASHQHETGAIRMARIYRHVTGMPWLLENEIDHVTAELKSNKTWHVREPCTMHVTREHQ